MANKQKGKGEVTAGLAFGALKGFRWLKAKKVK